TGGFLLKQARRTRPNIPVISLTHEKCRSGVDLPLANSACSSHAIVGPQNCAMASLTITQPRRSPRTTIREYAKGCQTSLVQEDQLQVEPVGDASQ
ncbi:unnamed protein product, partial [Ectocarpus sp. 12 AP-2014]